MVKRASIQLDDVADLHNLAAAAHRAAAGKRDRSEVQEFFSRFDHELCLLSKGIRNLDLELGRLRSFEIRDPKKRTIHAPCFRERVLHHALMAQMEPILEKALVFDSYACRVGKGNHAALDRVKSFIRRFTWYVQIDIRSYFATIDHEILKLLIRRRFKGKGILILCDQVIDAFQASPSRGLPIGALTSQHFANLYLAGFDRFLLEELRVGGMVRYMDDIVWFSHDRKSLVDSLGMAKDWLTGHRKLEIKRDMSLRKCQEGLTFCGFRILPHEVRLTRRRQRRYRRARRNWENAYTLGLIDELALQQGMQSVHAITQGADANAWRRAELSRRPSPDA